MLPDYVSLAYGDPRKVNPNLARKYTGIPIFTACIVNTMVVETDN